jgi:hypothetical protein
MEEFTMSKSKYHEAQAKLDRHREALERAKREYEESQRSYLDARAEAIVHQVEVDPDEVFMIVGRKFAQHMGVIQANENVKHMKEVLFSTEFREMIGGIVRSEMASALQEIMAGFVSIQAAAAIEVLTPEEVPVKDTEEVVEEKAQESVADVKVDGKLYIPGVPYLHGRKKPMIDWKNGNAMEIVFKHLDYLVQQSVDIRKYDSMGKAFPSVGQRALKEMGKWSNVVEAYVNL